MNGRFMCEKCVGRAVRVQQKLGMNGRCMCEKCVGRAVSGWHPITVQEDSS
jgi:hypothetical protein